MAFASRGLPLGQPSLALDLSFTEVPVAKIPLSLRWARYLCPLKYAINLMTIVEFQYVKDITQAGAALRRVQGEGCFMLFLCFLACVHVAPGSKTIKWWWWLFSWEVLPSQLTLTYATVKDCEKRSSEIECMQEHPGDYLRLQLVNTQSVLWDDWTQHFG